MLSFRDLLAFFWRTDEDERPPALQDGEPDLRDKGTPDEWVVRHPSLVRLTGAHPMNAELPLRMLQVDELITPTALHYVRNHGKVPKLEWKSHTIRLKLFGKEVRSVSMRDLEVLHVQTLAVTLSCAGNRRKELNSAKRTLGFDWGPSAVSTSNWTGPYLLEVLEEYLFPHLEDVDRKKARYVRFLGSDELPEGNYGTSVPIEIVQDASRECLLALWQNGERLSPDHGYPVRVVIPGFIGGRMVKWLSEIEVAETESRNFYHYHDNRLLPPGLDSAELVLEPALWKDPTYVIYGRNLNSAITSPGHGEALVFGQGDHTLPMSGYAYSGGDGVVRVEVSLNNGGNWLTAEIDGRLPPSAHGKQWCWVFWSIDIPLTSLVATRRVSVRAWDGCMNTQPRNSTWNLLGMMNNCWYTVRIITEWIGGGLAFRFVHPAPVGGSSAVG